MQLTQQLIALPPGFKVLEKMRPLDHKLKYQIDKLVRTAVTGSLGKTDFVLVAMNPSTNKLIFKLALA